MHGANKADAFAVRGAKEALLLAVVGDRVARRIDPRAQRRFGDDASVAHGSEQIVLADDALAVAHREFEEVEDLRLAGDPRPAAPQPAPRRTERDACKGAAHCPTPLSGVERISARALPS